MREILFRGYSTALRKWFEGDLIHSPEINHPCICNNDSFVNVSKKSIGQYTGLTDKNGKKIFEGDIIKRMWNGSLSIYQVVFDKYLAAFIGETKPYGMFTTFDSDGEWFEVIGNIHDNPELLKGGEADA